MYYYFFIFLRKKEVRLIKQVWSHTDFKSTDHMTWKLLSYNARIYIMKCIKRGVSFSLYYKSSESF